jgi:hypothetical protein
MVFKWHNSDYRPLANEDEVRAALRAGAPAPGPYVIPHCADMKKMAEEPMQQKYREGPVGFITLLPNGAPRMGKALGLWFVLNLLVACACGCLALAYVGRNGDGHDAGHLAGALSFLAYGVGSLQAGIWMGKRWGSVAKDLLDAFIYAFVTAFAFAWLWS